MQEISFPILSVLIFLPILAMVGILILPSKSDFIAKKVTLATCVAEFIISTMLFFSYDGVKSGGGFVYIESLSWIPSLGISYIVGVDGISLFLILLTTFLMVLSVLSIWEETNKIKWFLAFLLIEESAIIGTFSSLDMFLFYIFWEAVLIPMYFIIGVWGGSRRIYASVKFFIYTMLGGVLMLLAIFYLGYQHYLEAGFWSFSILDLYGTNLGLRLELVLFLAFALAFAIKVPLFPLHTWLPDAHVEAPTVGSVILAGVLLKMGTYGFLRFAIPLFPDVASEAAPYIIALAIIGIIYGALVAMVQPDIKKLVAYSSVSHLGFVVAGLFSFNIISFQGSMLQMVNHGLSTGALFLMVGMIYERRHTRVIEEFGGIARVMPVFATIFLIVTLSSIGLPLLNGFVGEWNILLGCFLQRPIVGILAGLGVVLGAWYMLSMVQRVFFGPCLKNENLILKDLKFREMCVMIPLVLSFFWIGLYPKPFFSRLEPSLNGILSKIDHINYKNSPQIVDLMRDNE